MQKIYIASLLISVAIIVAGCGGQTKKDVACEKLTADECGKYAEQCAVCPDGINLPTQSCHPKPYCNNFNF